MISLSVNHQLGHLNSPDPARTAGAAADFEALLIAGMLKTIREAGSGWLGTDGDDASATAFGLGEQSLAKAISASGGFGLGKMIQHGIERSVGDDSSRVSVGDSYSTSEHSHALEGSNSR